MAALVPSVNLNTVRLNVWDHVTHTPSIAFRHLKDVVNLCLESACNYGIREQTLKKGDCQLSSVCHLAISTDFHSACVHARSRVTL